MGPRGTQPIHRALPPNMAALPEIAVRPSRLSDSLAAPQSLRVPAPLRSPLALLSRAVFSDPLISSMSPGAPLLGTLRDACPPMTQDEILYMGFDAAAIGLPADFVLTDYSKVSARARRGTQHPLASGARAHSAAGRASRVGRTVPPAYACSSLGSAQLKG